MVCSGYKMMRTLKILLRKKIKKIEKEEAHVVGYGVFISDLKRL